MPASGTNNNYRAPASKPNPVRQQAAARVVSKGASEGEKNYQFGPKPEPKDYPRAIGPKNYSVHTKPHSTGPGVEQGRREGFQTSAHAFYPAYTGGSGPEALTNPGPSYKRYGGAPTESGKLRPSFRRGEQAV